MPILPTPNTIALQHSDQLMQLIRQAIHQDPGYLSFARYMEMALYTPGLGYYSAGSHKLGKEGDFITAPEISPLFAQCIAIQCQQIFNALGPHADMLELGAGTGKLASDLLKELERLGCLPQHYFILEISAELRERQHQTLKTTCPHLLHRIEWLDRLPETPIQGIIFANEVLDAMPVHCFRLDKGEIKEKCVTLIDDKLAWVLTPPTTPALTDSVMQIQQDNPLINGYESEVNLMLPAWIQTLADTLKQGVLLLIDYGYGRHEYYHPDRQQGTLLCHYQHHRHADPLILPGLQDITAHIDFTSVVESAANAGLMLAGYTTQAAFLLACGLLDLTINTSSEKEKYQQNQSIKLLTLPSQMGEIIKVMALSKDLETPLLGFSLHDRRHNL